MGACNEQRGRQRLLRTLSLHESSAALLSTCRMREKKVKVNKEKDGGLDQGQLSSAKFLLSLVSSLESKLPKVDESIIKFFFDPTLDSNESR